MNKTYALILSAGSGERVRYPVPKQFIKIAGKTILEHTIEIFERSRFIDKVIIVTHPQYKALLERIIRKNSYGKIWKIVNGGATRRESSWAGLKEIDDNDAYVLIHDAVRPLLSDAVIKRCVDALKKHQAVDVAIPSADTIIMRTDSMYISGIPKRRYMMRGQTPQAFKVGLIKKAHVRAQQGKACDVTDDCALVLKYKLAPVYVVLGEEDNIKITYMKDAFLADKLFQIKSGELSGAAPLRGLKDKVLVVFGARRGIGAAIAELARSRGARVYGFSKHDGTDVSRIGDVARALKSVYIHRRRIDYIVTTAG
ncbi:MAG: 2-C-methyl-D-erythritol 4-phosphate cytidylyltransferase, partial [Candidatus Omnitrophota bacterium]